MQMDMKYGCPECSQVLSWIMVLNEPWTIMCLVMERSPIHGGERQTTNKETFLGSSISWGCMHGWVMYESLNGHEERD